MLLMSRRKTTSFTTSCKGTRKGAGAERSPCRATSHSCKGRSNSAKPSKEKEIKSSRESAKNSSQNTPIPTNSIPAKQNRKDQLCGSMVTPPSGPSAPPQTVRKPDGPPPNDFELNLNFPDVPSGGLGGNNKPGNEGGGGNDLDFDELARRFDQLKKK